ncbi:hypothetical protein [Streptomyces prasinus]|uniref:hypothetical protein n=1 Tax=Streptomyces prasinus TaxID=67345 RepID=UPI0033A7390F
MTDVSTIRDLDALPDGTTVEILNKRGTCLFKEAGDWRSRDKTATQNVFTYVNTRRWGARVIERDTQ